MTTGKPYLSFVFLLLAAAASAQRPAPAKPLPADPLTPAEREKAVAIATEGATAKQMLVQGRYSLVGVELVNPKPAGARTEPAPGSTPRQASVLFFRYDKNDGLQALVDLSGGGARDLIAVDGRSVPIGRQEVERAAELALRNEAVTRLLGDAARSFRVGIARSDAESTIEGLRTLGAGPNDPCSRERCVDLFFRRGGSYIAGNRVTVDLSTDRVSVVDTREPR